MGVDLKNYCLAPGLQVLKLRRMKVLKAFDDEELHAHRFHLQTLLISKLCFSQNYYTFTLMLLAKITMCSKLP